MALPIYQRVGLVEDRDHDFADLAVLEGNARVRMADFHIGAVGDMQTVFVEAFIADATHVGSAVALTHEPDCWRGIWCFVS